ncbi:MAG TPA: serine/threonine-protein kinase, partial [Ktedonobacterales bacterium]
HDLARLLGGFEAEPTVLLRRQIRLTEPPAQAPADAPEQTPEQAPVRAQSFTLDLRDGALADESRQASEGGRWAHVHVRLRAEYSLRLSGQLQYTWRQDDGDEEEPAVGIAWSITRDLVVSDDDTMPPSATSEASTPIRSGVSDENGIGYFFLDDPGEYLLTTEIERQRWIVPFSVTHPARQAALIAPGPPLPDEQAALAIAATEQPTIGNLTGLPHQEAWYERIDATSIFVTRSASGDEDGAEDTPQLDSFVDVLTATSQRSPISVGQRLIDYGTVNIVVERVAQGGFGLVAMGPDATQGGRWRALKTLRWDALERADAVRSQLLRASFIREGLLSVGLWPHPNLLRVEGVAEVDGLPFIVSECVERGNLRDLFAQLHRDGRAFSIATALHFAQQIAAGLLALHTPAPDLMRDHPIVHGDLKPENILLDEFGYAHIADMDTVGVLKNAFEMERDSSGESADGAGGRVVGTPAYMAPEQWLDIATIVPATDAYAFGLVLAELLTGRHPLLDLEKPHSLAVWREAHVSGRQIPLRQLGADIFDSQRAALTSADSRATQDKALAQLERLVMRLLAKLPEARPTVAEALAEALAAAQALGEQPYMPSDIYPSTIEHQRDFWLHWADAYTSFGEHAQALQRIERAMALAPNESYALSAYAGSLMGVGRHDEALSAYRQALSATSGDDLRVRAIVLSQLADVLVQVARYAEAAQIAAEATGLAPDDAAIWSQRAAIEGRLAQMEAKARNLEEAREHARRGLDYAERANALSPASSHTRHVIDQLRRLRDTL